MSQKVEKQPGKLTRRQHFNYVMRFSIATWETIAFIAACFFPYYRTLEDIHHFNTRIWSIFWFLPGGIIWGILFGLVLNRFMLVAYMSEPKTEVPISWAARIGGKLSGWRGWALIFIGLGIYLGCAALKPVYYKSIIFETIPGLRLWQPIEVREWTVSELDCGDPDYIPAIVDVIRNEKDGDIRLRALMNTAYYIEEQVEDEGEDPKKFSDPRLIKTLINILDAEEYYQPQCLAASCLGTLRAREAFDAITKILKNSRWSYVRADAALALGKLGDKRAFKLLTEALENDKEIRRSIVMALGDLKDERAIEILKDILLKDKDEKARSRAVHALAKFQTEESIGILHNALPEIPDGKVRIDIIGWLGQYGNNTSLTIVREIMFNPDEDAFVRLTAARALKKHDPKNAVKGLVRMFNPDLEDLLRKWIAREMAKLHSSEALPLYIKIWTEDPDLAVRCQIEDSIGRFPEGFPCPDYAADADTRAKQKTAAMEWYEKNKDRLKWDDENRRWVLTRKDENK